MTKECFLRNLETLLGVPEMSIGLDQKLIEIEEWDSLAVISFIAFVDSELNTQVSAEKLIKCNVVSDLVDLFPDRIK